MFQSIVFPLLFSLLILKTAPVFSQNACENCLPQSEYHVSGSNIVESDIERKLSDEAVQKKFWEESDLSQLRLEIQKCNEAMKQKQNAITTEKSSWSALFTKVHKSKSIAGLEKQLSDERTNRQKAEENIRRDLANYQQVGLFVVIQPEKTGFASKPEVIKKSTEALHDRAVEDLNGTYIKRTTTLSNLDEVEDVIITMKNGKVEQVGDPLFFMLNRRAKHGVYFAKIGVSPLAPNSLPNSNSLAPQTNEEPPLVLNLLGADRSDFAQQLLDAKVLSEHIDSIRQQFRHHEKAVEIENQRVIAEKDTILYRGEKVLLDIDKHIQQLEKEIARRKDEIKLLCDTYLIRFDSNDTEGSAVRLLQHFVQKVKDLEKQWDQVWENEIFFQITLPDPENINVYKAIADACMGKARQIQENNGSDERSEEEFKIENLKTEEAKISRVKTVRRTVSDVWVYLVPQHDGSFRTGVCVRMKVGGGGYGKSPNEDKTKKPQTNEEEKQPPGTEVPKTPEIIVKPSFTIQVWDNLKTYNAPLDVVGVTTPLKTKITVNITATHSKNSRQGTLHLDEYTPSGKLDFDLPAGEYDYQLVSEADYQLTPEANFQLIPNITKKTTFNGTGKFKISSRQAKFKIKVILPTKVELVAF